ncbi:MAG: hypothetical protein HEP71_14465 [Roseivirga sp.]|nr:hypothetical protein [Roseivirga sp.]
MMDTKKFFALLLGILVALAAVSCQTDEDELPVDDEVIQQGGGDSEFGNSLVATYNVSGTQISLTQAGPASSGFYNTARQQEFWSFFTGLIPSDMWPQITKLTLYADDEDGTAAYVAPINENDLSKWEMGWNLAYVWDSNQELVKGETAFTAIHEFAHVLTLNAGQVNVSASACSSFHTGEGCSNNNSYINAFFQQFWTDIYDENKAITNDDGYLAFYQKYKNRFVSEYAATNPGEDIAETFAVFVVNNLPSGNSVADQKLNSLSEQEALVNMRQRIRENIDFNINLNAIGEARSSRAGLKTKHSHF